MLIESYDIDGTLIETREIPDPEPDATTVAIDEARAAIEGATTMAKLRAATTQVLDLLDPRVS